MRSLPRFLLLAAMLGACAAPADEGSSDSSEAIIGGRASGAEQDAVVLLSRSRQDGVSHCSGTRVAPNLILTARHCVGPTDDRRIGPGTECNDQGEPNVPELLEFGTASAPGDFDLHLESDRARSEDDVAAVLVKKGKPFYCGYDVALLVLSNEAAGLLGRKPIAKLRTGDPKLGESLTAIGYGLTSAGGKPASARQQRPIRVVAVRPTWLQDPKPDGTTDDSRVGLGEFATTEGPCSGDSGGPALDASGAIVGVVSRVTRCDRGGHAVYGGVRAHAAFLDAGRAYATCVQAKGLEACTAPSD
jgi:hypothetical protein